ncbi:hypothetical protein ACGH6Q_05430 [Gilliamella sp. BG2]|uniref:hypothetical protein n=1 Tax=Gilliamella sp. BG2 TaxID=3351509 RepID=UPI0039868A23
MPSITIYTTSDHHLETCDFADFSTSLTKLTKEILKAKDNNIHIAYLIADVGYGESVYFEAKLRQEIFRSESVMNEFSRQVDLLIREKFGVIARIRCFLYDSNNIFAKN